MDGPEEPESPDAEPEAPERGPAPDPGPEFRPPRDPRRRQTAGEDPWTGPDPRLSIEFF